MPFLPPIRRAGRWTAALAAFVLGSAAAWAAAPADAPPPADADLQLQVLKEEALQAHRDLIALEQSGNFPDRSRISLYIGVTVGGFMLDEFTAQIDNRTPVTHVYSPSESYSLVNDGWHRLLQVSLPPGNYRLHGEFKGHFFDASRKAPPVTFKLDTVFEKGLTELDIPWLISRNTRLDKPGLPEVSRLEARRLRPTRNVWLPQPERFESAVSGDDVGGETDPKYRYALFLFLDRQYFSALTELLDLQQAAPKDSLPPEFYRLLAEAYLDFGMPRPAERVIQQMAAGDGDAAEIARLRLELARFQYQRGYLDQAATGLQALKPPKPLLNDWRLVYANTLLAQARYNEAIGMMSKDLDELPGAVRYNLAVAMIRDGRVAEGRKQMNRVGTMDVATDEDLALRDKANVTLGYHYLQAQQGETARTLFGRVRTQGPFSNRALLGLGWAELAPVAAAKEPPPEAEGKTSSGSLGSLLRPGFVDPGMRSQLKLGDKAGSALSEKDRESLLRALVPWTELAKRDPMDPAVQEGMLAIPWALDRLQAYEQSLARYQEAIGTLETARKRMEEGMKAIRNGDMVYTMIHADIDAERGWKWQVSNLANKPETYFLQSLLAEHRFQEPLKNHRDATLLVKLEDSWHDRLVALYDGVFAGSGKVEQRLARARQTWRAPWAGLVVWLRYDTSLAPAGRYDAPRTDTPQPLELATADLPARFDGTVERAEPLMDRLKALKPRLSAAAEVQGRLLEQTAVRELDGQKKQIERYLTEARFAVARIYDRQRQGP
ncbi:MAG TPA: hypothetical protein VM369_05055 [Candidatus Binatia bacterium]|nr:hypothetical protein [Candidatus Binatia bacterium]